MATGELIGKILPFLIFIYLILISFGIIKTKDRNGNTKKYPKSVKTISILGTVGFAILIAVDLFK
ncbi:MAG: hypothetical protein ACOC2K_03040 [Bacteroidota bacterium]